MTDTLFSHDDSVAAGQVVQVEPLVRRVVGPNPGPYTYTGTCTYLVGDDEVAIIDPGPDDPGHLAILLDATAAGRRVSHIVVTHTHRDHTAGVEALRAATGAPVVGCAPHFSARALQVFERNEAAADLDYAPDRVLADGDRVSGKGWTLAAVATPGHTANHLAFALEENGALFSGDHVMAWSTTLVAPPDGSMAAYMAALASLRERDDRIYWPGHGGPVVDPRRYVRGLLSHRRQREASILARIEAGDTTIPEIVDKLYAGIGPELRGGASLSVLAHIESLVADRQVESDGPVRPDGRFRRR
ncbi:MBL fold metallo-hydrolase [Pseudochelatococcus contaminans]|uniref:Glyoxylase-like metal-dependent hydrolase (Beta-lactamase superfamily II) n=1 Tax=Pseudochelatococcus contaminans TaxID=1538103 RepID=A0A7W6EH94_9HYPH|nr:MBL fold metallo-hydrolase [Pseudochelatococcus contaminans]MBB3809989.1 glyoxylase-like metal-dependent hydrolase (beta-lactamase superfamily II) [Pseudochelatococcus contaminans]